MGTNPMPALSATAAAKMNPRDSGAATISAACARANSAIESITSANALGSRRSGVMSRKTMPGFGKLGTSRTRAWRCADAMGPDRSANGPRAGLTSRAMQRRLAGVLFNEQVRPQIWRLGLDFDWTREDARAARFVMLSFPDRSDPLLPRPYSISDAWLDDGRPVLELLYKPIGISTRLLTTLDPGDEVNIL